MNTDITILPADKGNATVVLSNTFHYNQKLGALLQDPAYRRLVKDSTETIEPKILLVF